MTPLSYDQTFSLCVGIILGSALTVLVIVLQAMFEKTPRQHLELGSSHDRLDDEAAQALGPILQAGADRQAARLRAELDDDSTVDRWLQDGPR